SPSEVRIRERRSRLQPIPDRLPAAPQRSYCGAVEPNRRCGETPTCWEHRNYGVACALEHRLCPASAPKRCPRCRSPKCSIIPARLDGPRAGTTNIVINWRFTDTHESPASTLEHGALTSITGKIAPNALTTLTTTRTVFESVILGKRTLADAMEH